MLIGGYGYSDSWPSPDYAEITVDTSGVIVHLEDYHFWGGRQETVCVKLSGLAEYPAYRCVRRTWNGTIYEGDEVYATY